MKATSRIIVSIAVTASSSFSMYSFAADDKPPALTAAAKITEAQATAAALARAPHGTVKSKELEKEKGRLIWSFDIVQPSLKGVTEIQIDAKTGKVVSVKRETPAQEMKESKAEHPAPK